MNLRQNSSQSAKEFADIIKKKLKDLTDITRAQYDNVEVLKSFRIEHEKIASRTLKEGLRQPLKSRVVNTDSKTFDDLIKRAVQEEPFVTMPKSSLNSEQQDSFKPNRNENYVKNYWSDSVNGPRNVKRQLVLTTSLGGSQGTPVVSIDLPPPILGGTTGEMITLK